MVNAWEGHDVATLPKWAQALIRQLEVERDLLLHLEKAHAVLQGREWFTVQGPSPDTPYPKDERNLWILNNDNPLRVATIYPGDVLLIGRDKKRSCTPSPATVPRAEAEA